MLTYSWLSGERSEKNSFSEKLHNLNSAYQDSLKAQHGGLTADFLHTWGNRYWKLVKANPNHKQSAKVARKAFEIYEELQNPNIYEEKLNELSIHDRALSGIVFYWNRVLDNRLIQKWEKIAEKSHSEVVQIATRFCMARHYTKFKHFDKAAKQLNLLDLNHQVYDTHPIYGKSIRKCGLLLMIFQPEKYCLLLPPEC